MNIKRLYLQSMLLTSISICVIVCFTGGHASAQQISKCSRGEEALKYQLPHFQFSSPRRINFPLFVNNATATALNLANTYSNYAIYINGTFTIDQNFTCSNCTFYMTANAKIQLQNNYTFTANTCTFVAACGALWDGIYADDASEQIVLDGCTISDMQNGIDISNNARLAATGNTLSNNQRHIYYHAMTDQSYAAVVEGNTITSNASMIVQNGISKGQVGIEIFDCATIQIGNQSNASTGNTLSNLYTGIYVHGSANIGQVLTDPESNIGLYNNSFSNILSGALPLQNPYDPYQLYNSREGAAIYIDYSQCLNHDANTEVANAALPASANIDNCDKAVVSLNNSLTAMQQYSAATPFGILSNTQFNRTCNVSNNTLEAVQLGIQLAGNYTGYQVGNNTISTGIGSQVSNAGFGLMAQTFSATAIDLKHYNALPVSLPVFVVDANQITIPYNAGIGIGCVGANENQVLSNNNIMFTGSSSTPAPSLTYRDPSLYGIHLSNSDGTSILSNLVDGQYTAAKYLSTYSKAYYFALTKNTTIICNKAKTVKQGLYAWGNNQTGDQRIAHNKFRYVKNPMYTLDHGAPQIGTFGNIGNGTIDNENNYTYNMTNPSNWLQSGVYKVWRESNIVVNHSIKTSSSLLTSSESGSPADVNGINNAFRYLVSNPVGMTYTDGSCPDPTFGNSTEADPETWDVEDDEAMIADGIAQQTESYIAYLQVGTWLNQQWLYQTLSRDEAMRNSSTVLSNFYNNYRTTIHGNVEKAELAAHALFDFTGNTENITALYDSIVQYNQEIVSTDVHEANIVAVNLIQARLGLFGIDSLSTAQKLELEVLAHTCPYVGGSAVFKARVLYSQLNPFATYNDRLSCLQTTTARMAAGAPPQNIDSIYEVSADSLGALQLQKDAAIGANLPAANSTDTAQSVQVFPTIIDQEIFVLGVQTESMLTLTNGIGQVVHQTLLHSSPTAQAVSLPMLANGYYHCTVHSKNQVYNFKVVVSRND
ncbi:MAG: hypothetical protein RL660_2416 [Bacteroidota bacterium]